MHALASPRLYFPASQSEQKVRPARSVNFPAVQEEHDSDWARLNLPLEQMEHEPDIAALNLPASHTVHEEDDSTE
jgi:hypothetical protein